MNNFDIEIVANTNNYPIPYISIIDQPQNVNHEHVVFFLFLIEISNFFINRLSILKNYYKI